MRPEPPTADRYRSALGDRRETAVPCWACRCPTYALDALCDRCAAATAPAQVPARVA